VAIYITLQDFNVHGANTTHGTDIKLASRLGMHALLFLISFGFLALSIRGLLLPALGLLTLCSSSELLVLFAAETFPCSALQKERGF
jgi:hypothetical protein